MSRAVDRPPPKPYNSVVQKWAAWHNRMQEHGNFKQMGERSLPFFIFVLQMVTLACIAYCKEKLIVDRVGAPFAWAARDTCC